MHIAEQPPLGEAVSDKESVEVNKCMHFDRDKTYAARRGYALSRELTRRHCTYELSIARERERD